jgi:hypothetical protein
MPQKCVKKELGALGQAACQMKNKYGAYKSGILNKVQFENKYSGKKNCAFLNLSWACRVVAKWKGLKKGEKLTDAEKRVIKDAFNIKDGETPWNSKGKNRGK